jgi:hypothetical protein
MTRAATVRLFRILVTLLFTIGGIATILQGERLGWFAAIFFGLCFVIAVIEPWLPKRDTSFGYRLLITSDEIACEHPKRARESIRWEEVIKIWYVTTSDGPWLPDEWLLLEGTEGGCSFPTEAKGFEGIWDELEARFTGFDWGPLIRGGTDDAKHLCWERGVARVQDKGDGA